MSETSRTSKPFRPGLVTLAVAWVAAGLVSCESREEFEGGTRLVFRIDAGRALRGTPESLRDAGRKVVVSRLEAFGIEKFRVNAGGTDRLRVEVPATSDLKAIRKLVTERGEFTFHLVVDEKDGGNVARYEAEEASFRTSRQAWVRAFQEWSNRKRKDPESAGPPPDEPPPPGRIVRREADGTPRVLDNEEDKYIGGEEIMTATVTFDDQARPALAIDLSDSGATRLADLTASNIGRSLAIVLDDVVVQTATIRSRIGRHAQITGDFTLAEVQALGSLLGCGTLPAPFEFVEEKPLE